MGEFCFSRGGALQRGGEPLQCCFNPAPRPAGGARGVPVRGRPQRGEGRPARRMGPGGFQSANVPNGESAAVPSASRETASASPEAKPHANSPTAGGPRRGPRRGWSMEKWLCWGSLGTAGVLLLLFLLDL